MDILQQLLLLLLGVMSFVVARLGAPKDFAFSFHELILTYAYVAGGAGVLTALHGAALVAKAGFGYAFDPRFVYAQYSGNPPEDLALGIGLLLVGTLAIRIHRRLRQAWIRLDNANDRFLDRSYLVFQLCFTAGVTWFAFVSFVRDTVGFALGVTTQGPLGTLAEFAFFAPAWMLYLRAVLIRQSLSKTASVADRATEVASSVQPSAAPASSEQPHPTAG